MTLTSYMTLTSDLDPMTLILKLDLDMVRMYYHTKNEVSMLTTSKVIAQTHTHTHTTKILSLPHMWEVISFPKSLPESKISINL